VTRGAGERRLKNLPVNAVDKLLPVELKAVGFQNRSEKWSGLGNRCSIHLSYSPALPHCNTFPAGCAALCVAAKETNSASRQAARAVSYPVPIPERLCRSATS
jgi:hypothetical protein